MTLSRRFALERMKMLLPELGLTVARQIPVEMIGGLLSGGYSLHGGVIRNGAGQIVSHLATVGGSGLRDCSQIT